MTEPTIKISAEDFASNTIRTIQRQLHEMDVATKLHLYKAALQAAFWALLIAIEVSVLWAIWR